MRLRKWDCWGSELCFDDQAIAIQTVLSEGGWSVLENRRLKERKTEGGRTLSVTPSRSVPGDERLTLHALFPKTLSGMTL